MKKFNGLCCVTLGFPESAEIFESLISVEEKLARWRKEQGRGERVLSVYKGDKHGPLAQRGGRAGADERVRVFKGAIPQEFFRNGEVNSTICPKFVGNSSEIHRRVVISHICCW